MITDSEEADLWGAADQSEEDLLEADRLVVDRSGAVPVYLLEDQEEKEYRYEVEQRLLYWSMEQDELVVKVRFCPVGESMLVIEG
jgi:hypothetical protein